MQYRRACRHANKLINTSRQWTLSLKSCRATTDCKKRWQVANRFSALLCRTVHKRTTEELKQLCSKLHTGFINEIVSLRPTVSARLASLSYHDLGIDPIHTGETFESVARCFCRWGSKARSHPYLLNHHQLTLAANPCHETLPFSFSEMHCRISSNLSISSRESLVWVQVRWYHPTAHYTISRYETGISATVQSRTLNT